MSNTIIENDRCKLEIIDNPDNLPEQGSRYFQVNLLSGEWPAFGLVNICVNKKFYGEPYPLGGKTRKSLNVAHVEAYTR